VSVIYLKKCIASHRRLYTNVVLYIKYVHIYLFIDNLKKLVSVSKDFVWF
jgi:hypothetical protein